MATTLPKFRGFRSTGIELPSSSQGASQSVRQQTVQVPKQEKKKDGFFTSLAKGLVKPAVDYTKFVGEAVAQGGRALLDPTMRKAVFTPNKMTLEDHKKMANKRATFFVDEKDIKDRKTIAKTGLKRTAGAMTYAIPGGIGGKGLAATARAGAVTGGLYGLYEGDDIDPTRIFTNAATGAVAAPAMLLGGRALGKAGNAVRGKISGKTSGLRQKAGQKLLDEADDFAVKSTRINTSRQNKFKKATGKTIGEFIEENNLYGQDLDNVQALIDPLQKARTQAVRGGNKMVNPNDIIDDFNRQIKQLTTGSNALDPSNLSRANALTKARDQFADEATRYAMEVGDDAISQYPLAFLDDARASIDRNTPASQFLTNPVEAGNQRAIGSVYRDRVNTTAGTKDTGVKLRNLYQFRDALEAAPKGNNTLPLGLNKGLYGTFGSVATKGEKIPLVGGLIGMGAESVINNPNNIGRVSRGMKAAGNALLNSQAPRLPAMPTIPGVAATRNAISRVPSNVGRNAAINSVNAGVNNMSQQTPEAQASRQEVVFALIQQGVTDPEQIAQLINESAMRQGMNPDFTVEEVIQYTGGGANSTGQLPSFRGFTSTGR